MALEEISLYGLVNLKAMPRALEKLGNLKKINIGDKGLLNNAPPTGNELEQLQLWGRDNYTNECMYLQQPAVSAGTLITANGSANLEFAREMLLLLKVDTSENIARYYEFNRNGFC